MYSRTSQVKFEKIRIDRNFCEAASVFDVNNDGIPDIVCGEYWYEGPDYAIKHKIGDMEIIGGYLPDFSDYGMDVNGDGLTDIVTGFWHTKKLQWKENPGRDVPWKVHDIDMPGSIETVRFFDIDGCGVPEVFPNTPWDRPVYYKLICDEQGRGTGQFTKHVMADIIMEHGLGFGDISGNGKTDIVLRYGWLEQPDDPAQGPWTFHNDYELPHRASVPMIVHDVNGDGLNDIITGYAHNYGLVWLEQVYEHGRRSWTLHEIDMTVSQYHDLRLADIDGDGSLELITGKRFKAHNGRDPGTDDPLGVYYFKLNNGHFEKYAIDFGGPADASGLGIYFDLYDLSGSGRLDIIAPGKEGLYLFKNHGPR